MRTKTEGEEGWENDSREEARMTEKQKGRETNGRKKRKDRNLFEVERRSGGALSVFIIKPVVWGEGILSSPGTDFQRIY